jgi:hypothetical protein
MSFKDAACTAGRIIRDWTWFEVLNAWLTQSLSTLAGASFTWATIWVMLVAGDKPFVVAILHAIVQDNAVTVYTITFITFFADSAYIVLPEIIIFGGILRVIYFISACVRGESPAINRTWAILYGLPLTMFGIVTFYTVTSSLGNSAFSLPPWIIMARGACALAYAYISNTKINLDAGIHASGQTRKQGGIQTRARVQPVYVAPVAPPVNMAEGQYYSIDHGTDPNIPPLASDQGEENDVPTQAQITEQEQVLHALLNDPTLTTGELCSRIGTSRRTVDRGRQMFEEQQKAAR